MQRFEWKGKQKQLPGKYPLLQNSFSGYLKINRINWCQELKIRIISLIWGHRTFQRRLWYISVFCRLPVFLQRLLLRSDLCVQICSRPLRVRTTRCVCVCVSVYQFVSVLCCRTGENKSPAVVLISSSFVSVLRDQLSARCLPLQLHLLQTIITPFNANASQPADHRPTTGSTGRQKRVFRTNFESERVNVMSTFPAEREKDQTPK